MYIYIYIYIYIHTYILLCFVLHTPLIYFHSSVLGPIPLIPSFLSFCTHTAVHTHMPPHTCRYIHVCVHTRACLMSTHTPFQQPLLLHPNLEFFIPQLPSACYFTFYVSLCLYALLPFLPFTTFSFFIFLPFSLTTLISFALS